jgi:hypothetical protein
MEFLKNYAAEDDLEDWIFKYKKFLFNNLVDANPNLRWCPVCSKEPCDEGGSMNKYERDLKALKNCVIQLDDHRILDNEGNLLAQDQSISMQFKKKANSIFRRSNPYHGSCSRCSYEICMRCGLPYHR